MKRLLPIFLMALVVGACGAATPSESPVSESPVAEVTPTPCAVAPLPCAPERVLVLAGPDTEEGYPNGMIIIFENGTGFSHTFDDQSFSHYTQDSFVRVWNWGTEATAPIFAAFDAAEPLLTVPAGSHVTCSADDEYLNYVQGRWCANDLKVEPWEERAGEERSLTSIDGALAAVYEIALVIPHNKKTGEPIFSWSPSVADPNTLMMIDLDRSGTITLDGAAVQAAVPSLLESGVATDVTDRFLAAIGPDGLFEAAGSREITGYDGILPDWLDPQSVYWNGIFDAQGGG